MTLSPLLALAALEVAAPLLTSAGTVTGLAAAEPPKPPLLLGGV